jgi:hypothetical protein
MNKLPEYRKEELSQGNWGGAYLRGKEFNECLDLVRPIIEQLETELEYLKKELVIARQE